MSVQQIKDLTKEELKTKSENLVLLYEYLMREDARREFKGVKALNTRPLTISDAELRELMSQSVPTHLNMNCLFT